MKTGSVEEWTRRARRLKTETYALYLAYKDPRTPWYARLFAACVVGYACSPIDLIPDFIPVLGYLDDLVLVPLGLVLALKMMPASVMADCRAKAQEDVHGGRPTNWMATGIVIAIWLLLAALVLLLVARAL